MGGKPWQSKGCLNCRELKKKCDKKEPECERCLKRGVKCQGYNNLRMFFYDEGPKKPGEKKIKKLERKTVEVGEAPSSSPSRSDSGQALAVQAPDTTVNSGPAAREQLFAAYVTSYFPIDVTGATQLDPWFDLVEGTATLPSRPMMLEKAVAAKSCLFLGKINNDERMFCHGLQLFNNAIQHMSRQLSRKKNVYSDELVFTVVYFQKLVSCYCPHGLDVWIGQMEVTNGILKQCARRASNNPMIQSIYLAFQRVRLLQALSPMQSKKVIRPTEDEYAFPLALNLDDPSDRLLNLMSTISNFTAAINTVNASCDSRYYQNLIVDCLAHKEKILQWYSQDVNLIGGRPTIYPSNETIDTALIPAGHLFGASYRFSSVENARLTILFWCSLSILHGLIAQARTLAYYPRPVDILTDEDVILTEFYADEISRSLPYCLQRSMKAWGASLAFLGIGQICKIYMEYRRYEKFVFSQEAFRVIGDLGYDLAFRLSELLWYQWNLAAPEQSLSPPESTSSERPIVVEYAKIRDAETSLAYEQSYEQSYTEPS